MNFAVLATTIHMMWKVFQYSIKGTGVKPKKIRQKG